MEISNVWIAWKGAVMGGEAEEGLAGDFPLWADGGLILAPLEKHCSFIILYQQGYIEWSRHPSKFVLDHRERAAPLSRRRHLLCLKDSLSKS
jgi:hypothetical protein